LKKNFFNCAASLTQGVEVDVSKLTGVPAGEHGFHIHQFGDSSSPANVGGHFTPICKTRRFLDFHGATTLTCGDSATNRDCRCDEIHGFPPETKRMPGDMGNLLCASDGTCKLCFKDETDSTGCAVKKILLQEKMGLNDALRSIVGRSLAIHERKDSVVGITDNGLGDAGPALAYGTVGITAPGVALPGAPAASSSTSDTNIAAPPGKPAADKAICIFRKNVGNINTDIEGKAIISIDLTKKLSGATDYCNMRAELSGLSEGVRSFHFHDHGDLRYGLTSDATLKSKLIGPIHNSNKLSVSSWNVPASLKQVYSTACTLGDVAELVGRSLTVHSGAESSTPTIAMAVCGLANPASCFDDSTETSLRCGSVVSPNAPAPNAPAPNANVAGHDATMNILASICIALAFVKLW
jgi:Cu/Zn superoxide dismutase